MPEVCPDAAEQLRQQQESYQNSSAAQSMMAFRAKLPSFHMRDEFLSALASHQARPPRSSSLSWFSALCPWPILLTGLIDGIIYILLHAV